MSEDFRDLLVWQKSMELVVLVYSLSKAFPADERFGLTSQLRRSAISLPSNIAEGQGRETPGDFGRFLNIARGSLSELQTQLVLAQRLALANPEDIAKALTAADEVGRMLRGLRNALDS
jgi:four helix bundle protein